MTTRRHTLDKQPWLGKAAAGIVLGFGLALAASGFFVHLSPGEVANDSAKLQLTMWSLAPGWILVLSFSFLFRTSKRAWLWLGVANLSAFGLLFAMGGLRGAW